MGFDWKSLAGGSVVGAGLMGLTKKNKGGLDVAADPYGSTRKALLDWLNPQIGKAGPTYSGEMVAPMSDQEKESLSYLKQYGDAKPGSTYESAKKNINDTLNNNFDPSTSPYYQATKAKAERNAQQVNKQIASNAAGGGRYFAGSRMKEQREAGVDTANSLNQTLGSLAQQERQNQLSVLPQAISMGLNEQQDPLKKATAFQTLGALPRSIQQAIDQANLDQWTQSNITYPMQIATMAGNIQTPPTYQQKPPDFLTQLMGGSGNAMGSMLPLLMMGL